MASSSEHPEELLPVKRNWVSVGTQSPGSISDSEGFVIVSYNVLGDCHVTGETYPYLPKGYRTMTERHPQLLMELLHHKDADVICLQEVNGNYFNEVLAPTLAEHGYKGIQCDKALGVDEGPATFYKQSRFELENHKVVYFKDQMQELVSKRSLPKVQADAIIEWTLKETVSMFLRLRDMKTENFLTLGNVHQFWKNREAMDVITLQAALAVNQLVRFAGGINSALILCGDFNTQPHMPGYQLLGNGLLSEQSIETLRGFSVSPQDDSSKSFCLIDVLSSCFQHPVSHFRSAYKTVMGVEVPFSQFHDPSGTGWRALQEGSATQTGKEQTSDKVPLMGVALDYLWFSSGRLNCQGVLEMVDRGVLYTLYACPNRFFPSDHLLMKANFCFKEPVA